MAHFESTHCLALQHMGPSYLAARADLITACLDAARRCAAARLAAHEERACILPALVSSPGPACLSAARRTAPRCAMGWSKATSEATQRP